MRDILLLVGLSGSGKDYLSKKLVQDYDFNNMVSYTTRPMRDGEINGVEYHFISTNEEFNELVDSGEIFEKTEYETVHGLWLYGYGRKSIPEKGKYNNVAIVNPDGVRQFLESEIKDRICILDITSPNHLRLEQICNRYGGIQNMTDKQMCEAFRREVEDAKPFHEYMNVTGKWKGIAKSFGYSHWREWFHKYNGLTDAIKQIQCMMEV